jgi:DNA-binding Lrp family transcriptional regulator
MVHVVAADADDLYRIAGQILAIPGVERTNTALVMRELADYRITPLLRHASGA